MEDCGIEVAHVYRIVLEARRFLAVLIHDVVTVFIRLAVNDSALDSTTGHPGGKAPGVMISAIAKEFYPKVKCFILESEESDNLEKLTLAQAKILVANGIFVGLNIRSVRSNLFYLEDKEFYALCILFYIYGLFFGLCFCGL